MRCPPPPVCGHPSVALRLVLALLAAVPRPSLGLRRPAAVGLHRHSGAAGHARARHRSPTKPHATARGPPAGSSSEPGPCAWAEELAAARLRGPEQACSGSTFGPASGPAPDRRLALLLRGESFRGDRGQGDRGDEVTPASWASQFEAATSHVKLFLEPAEACGYTVDVFFVTYDHEANAVSGNATLALARHYGPRLQDTLVVSPRLKDPPGMHIKGLWNQRVMFGEGLQRIGAHHRKHNVTYDAMLVLRHDVVLEQPLLQLPRVPWQLVLFAWNEKHEGLQEPVGDAIQWYPWRYANCLVSCGFRGHNSSACLRPAVGKRNIGYLLRGRHVTDTGTEPNPLYRLVRRTPGKTALILLDLGTASGLQTRNRSEVAASADPLAAAGAAFQKHVVTPNAGSQPLHGEPEILAYGLDAAWEAPRRAFGRLADSAHGAVDGRPLAQLPCQDQHAGAAAREFIAWAYATKQAVALLRRREGEQHAIYENVLLCRSDAVLQSDVRVGKIVLDRNTVYKLALQGGGGLGFGHLAMSRDLAVRFGELLYSGVPRHHCRFDPDSMLESFVRVGLHAQLEVVELGLPRGAGG